MNDSTELLYKSILDNLYDGVYFVDRERTITYWNNGAERISGYAGARVVGSKCYDNILAHVDGNGEALCTSDCPLVKAMLEGHNIEVDVYLHHANGQRVPVTVRVSPIRDETGQITGAVEVFSDSSAKLAALEKVSELQREAFIDPLTGVGNRRYTEMRLKAHLEEMNQGGIPFGVIAYDLDHFKEVNDLHGHGTGDRALVIASQTVARCLQSFDFIGRMGGDEFLVILANAGLERLKKAAQTARRLVSQSFLEESADPVRVTVSMGATLARPGEALSDLYSRVDALLYASKKNGRNRVTIG